ncbi:MAG: RNA-binding protein [Flavobacteriia bacterium]|jgi:RNA recognition motif-containing protein|nr:RNA-binding protein [Flavobacteriia bacterium]NBV68985.1 RNA-binding protein [Flavobacteriia bacterium]NBV91761.1 RNA-binding protein [Flavobacteriia bacterium]NBY41448.1 RNA-binding protein [Flavobacteriia bacterium]
MNMYVSNLSFRVGEQELGELFAQYGEVASVKIITDRETGRSRGFGFVVMDSDEEAQNAMNALSNFELGGRNINVSEARQRDESEQKGKRW